MWQSTDGRGFNSRRLHQKCYHIFMVEQQILITIATLAVTLAGFSGVVGIFSKELSAVKAGVPVPASDIIFDFAEGFPQRLTNHPKLI